MNSHIINGHYMFGNTFVQPEMYGYNKIAHHNMAPVVRAMPPYPDMNTRPIQCENCSEGDCLNYEDNTTKINTSYSESDNNSACDDCLFGSNEIIRDPLINNIINIETSVIKTLKVTLYGVSSDQDKTIEMKTGNRYAVTYITEHGLMTSVGYLELISDSVPDECTRYINTNNMAAASTAYIGMDCSTEGRSNKRKIYIATIRYIQELASDQEPDNVIQTKSFKERVESVLDKLDKEEIIDRVDEHLDDIEDFGITVIE